jgi:hypothetical protein
MAPTSFNVCSGDGSPDWPSLHEAKKKQRACSNVTQEQPKQRAEACDSLPRLLGNEHLKLPVRPPPGLELESKIAFKSDCGSNCSTEPGSTESNAIDEKPHDQNESRPLPAWLMPQASKPSSLSTWKNDLREKGREALAMIDSEEMSRRSVGQTSRDRLCATGEEVLKGIAKNRPSHMAATSSVSEVLPPQHRFWNAPPGFLEATTQQSMISHMPLPLTPLSLLGNAQASNLTEPQRISLVDFLAHMAGTASSASLDIDDQFNMGAGADRNRCTADQSPMKVDLATLKSAHL